MSTPGGSFIHVYMGHRLLIRQVGMPSNGSFDMSRYQLMAYSTFWMPLMVSTAFICPVEWTDVYACWLFVCWATSFDSCAQCYGML